MSNLTKVEYRKPGADQHVYIGTPAHTIYANFHVSLLRNVLALVDAGVSVTYAHLAGHCHVDDARNLLVADFLKSNATDLLFWDGDVAAEPGAALKLLSYSVDILGGAYPLKDGAGKFPARLRERGSGGLWQADYVPTGFLRIRRFVFETLGKTACVANLDGQVAVPLLFQRSISGRDRIGGDVEFCRQAVDRGFKVWCDPSLLFTHAGVVDFAGRLSDHLKQGTDA